MVILFLRNSVKLFFEHIKSVIKNHLTTCFTMISDASAALQNNSSRKCFQAMFTFGLRDQIPSFATHFRHISTRNQSSEMLTLSSTKVQIQGLLPMG